ncbi:MAG: DNA polymerase III subunit epsilon [Betaproteobacteria bacterium]|nr:MAG: DNA polymerase III subunit epsilon [Betaproteobacteria bacterium]
MTRQIVLDTETTGLEPELGHRIIELGAVELRNRRPTGNHFHYYINPERESDEAALRVHGISNEFLLDKPKFREVAAQFLDYVSGAELIIHNAAFDIAFLDHELARIGLPPISKCCPAVTDTLRLARDLHPGKRNGLDALCDRYQIDNSHRTLHGALLDAQLLAEVYLAMTRGQDSLLINLAEDSAGIVDTLVTERYTLTVHPASADELAAHRQYLQDLDKACKAPCVWSRLFADAS